MLNKSMREMLKDQSGMALPMALILLVVATFIVVPGLWAVGSMIKVNQDLENDTMAYYAAKSGFADVIWNFKNGVIPGWIGSPPSYMPYALPGNPINGMTVKVTQLNVINIGPFSNIYTIKSEGIDSSGATRSTIYSELVVNAGSSPFEYGIVALNGGITMSNSSNVTSIPPGHGNIFANGPIIFNNTATIDGAASSTSTITGCAAANGCYPNSTSPNFVLVDNTTYLQKANYETPSVGDRTYKNTTASLGGITIKGDLVIDKSTITLTGPVWVTGSITCKGGTLIGTTDMTTNYLLANGSILFQTFSTVINNPTIISWYNGITFEQQAEGTLNTLGTLYAPYGPISLSQGATVNGSIVGQSVQLGQSGSDVYLVNNPNSVSGELSGGSGVTLTKYSIQ